MTKLDTTKILTMMMMMSLMSISNLSQKLIPMLLNLEAMMLLNFYAMELSSGTHLTLLNNKMAFLTFAVCEASIGLGLLVSYSRNQGTDQLSVMQ